MPACGDGTTTLGADRGGFGALEAGAFPVGEVAGLGATGAVGALRGTTGALSFGLGTAGGSGLGGLTGAAGVGSAAVGAAGASGMTRTLVVDAGCGKTKPLPRRLIPLKKPILRWKPRFFDFKGDLGDCCIMSVSLLTVLESGSKW